MVIASMPLPDPYDGKEGEAAAGVSREQPIIDWSAWESVVGEQAAPAEENGPAVVEDEDDRPLVDEKSWLPPLSPAQVKLAEELSSAKTPQEFIDILESRKQDPQQKYLDGLVEV